MNYRFRITVQFKNGPFRTLYALTLSECLSWVKAVFEYGVETRIGQNTVEYYGHDDVDSVTITTYSAD